MTRCEDYPCCGHTDGLGCNYVPDYKHIYKHAGCDHEAGDCLLDEEEDDDQDDEVQVHLSFDEDSICVLGEAPNGNFDVVLAEQDFPRRTGQASRDDFEQDVDDVLAAAGLRRVAPRFFQDEDFGYLACSTVVRVTARRS